MSTPKQTAAARANGALSKGPVSIEGKRNSSRNRLRHGLLARTVVLEEESTPRFLELLESLVAEFRPASPTQFLLVETMAVARWRLLRIWGLQKVALDREIALQDPALGPAEVRAALAFGKSAETPQPDLLLRYEVANDRQFHRALKQLLALQSNPAARPAEPYHPASLPAQTWREPPQPSEPPAGSERTQQPVDSTHHAESTRPGAAPPPSPSFRPEPPPEGAAESPGGCAGVEASKSSNPVHRTPFIEPHSSNRKAAEFRPSSDEFPTQ